MIEEMDFLTENCITIEIQELAKDKILSRACLRSLEIIGEWRLSEKLQGIFQKT